MAAPAEPRTPNMHRANQSLLESADGSMATVATRRENKQCFTKPEENRLDSDRPSHGRRLHSKPPGSVNECYDDLSPTDLDQSIPVQNSVAVPLRSRGQARSSGCQNRASPIHQHRTVITGIATINHRSRVVCDHRFVSPKSNSRQVETHIPLRRMTRITGKRILGRPVYLMEVGNSLQRSVKAAELACNSRASPSNGRRFKQRREIVWATKENSGVSTPTIHLEFISRALSFLPSLRQYGGACPRSL